MSANDSMADQLRPMADRIHRHVPRQIPVVRVTADIGSDDLDAATAAVREEVLKWLSRRSGQLPAQAWAGEDFENPVAGVHCTGVRLRKGDVDCWASRLDYSGEGVWTTETIVAQDKANGRASFGLQLSFSTRDFDVDFQPTMPGVLHQIIENVGLVRNGRSLSDQVMEVRSDEEVGEMVDVIADPRRRRPVIVVSLDEHENDVSTAIVDVKELAWRTAGVAHIYAVTGDATYCLSDRLGKTYSVFHRGIRTYRPGFDPEVHAPYEHPLALPNRIENWRDIGPTAFVDEIVRSAAAASVRLFRNQQDVLSFSAIKSASLAERRIELETRQLSNEGSSAFDEEMKRNYEATIEELRRDTDLAQSLAVGEEARRCRVEEEIQKVRSSNTWMKERIRQLENSIAEQTGDGRDADIPIPDELSDLPGWVSRYLPGLISVTGRAARTARDGQYKDVKLVYGCVLMLAREYRDMRISGGRDLFDEKCKELGVECSKSFAGAGAGEFGDLYFVQYNGQSRELEWHLAKGNDHNQKNCLRMYFFWDDDDEMVVLGALPGHLRNRMS